MKMIPNTKEANTETEVSLRAIIKVMYHQEALSHFYLVIKQYYSMVTLEFLR
jgi:hypothetical protein